MSAQVLFDQFAYTDRLKAGGFTDNQARASAEALRTALTETVSTKTDIEKLEAKIDTLQKSLLTEMKTLIADSNVTTIKWVIAIGIALAGLFSGGVFAVIKSLSHSP